MAAPNDRFSSARRLIAGAAAVAGLVVACGGAGDTGVIDRPGGGQPSDSNAGGAREPVRFARIAITDPAADNLEAMTFLAPAGWQYEGSVQWLPEWARIAFLQTRVSDPATGLTIDFLPIQNFIWFQAPAGLEPPLGGNYQGKVYLPPITDPAEFVTRFWMPDTLAHLQGAQLVSVEQVPAIAQDFVDGFGGPAEAFAYRLRYEYEQAGQTWEEDVSLALLYAGTPELTSWFVNFAYTVRAPKGELDRSAGVISTVVASRTTTPGWEATYLLVQQLFTQGIKQQMADTVAFGQTLAQHRAELQALQAQVTADRLASQDRIAELRRETLGGVETYTNPVDGAPVQLPVGWNEYWVNDRGEYLTSDQAAFDPNSLNDGFWQRLERRTP